MSKSDLQQLYEKERQELEDLKRRLADALTQKQTAASLFKEIKQKLDDIGSNIESIKNDKNVLMSKHEFKINLFSNMFFVISCLLLIFLLFGGLIAIPIFIWNVLKLQIFNSYAGLLTFVGSIICHIIGFRFLCIEIMPKIEGELMQKMNTYFTNKTMNSTEYKELEFLLEASLELSEREKLEYNLYEAEKKKTSENYSAIKEKYDIKKGIVEYLDKQINPVETTLNLNRSLNQKERNKKWLKVNINL